MFGSRNSPNPDRPHNPAPEPPPKPTDRYALTECIRLDLRDMNGAPVAVILSRRAARLLADQLLAQLCIEPRAGGVK